MNREKQRAAAVERRSAAYQEELEQMEARELLHSDLDLLLMKHEAEAESAREQLIHTLLERRKQQLAEMSDEDLLKDDDED